MASDLHTLSAHQLLAGYRSRQFSPVEVLRDVLRQIERWEPHLDATWRLRPDAALADAHGKQRQALLDCWDDYVAVAQLEDDVEYDNRNRSTDFEVVYRS